MSLKLKTAERRYGEEQPYIPVGPFHLRIPLIHAPIEIPEIVQSAIVIVVGISATTYLEEMFGIPFHLALGMVVAAESFKAIQNMLGDPLVGGWITPAIPIVVAFLTSFDNLTDRMHALIWLQLFLGALYIFLGMTGLAAKLVNSVPTTVKSGILIGSSISAIVGNYGFAAEGVGFFARPIAFTVGVLFSLFLLYSVGFNNIKQRYQNKIMDFIAKSGFVPALLAAFLIGTMVGEVALPKFDFSEGLFFNPIPGILYAFREFSLVGLGFGKWNVIISALPVAFIVYIISFGNIVTGLEFVSETADSRPDEIVHADANLANFMAGIRNLLQGLFFPSVVLSGPLWTAMMVTITERYKSGKDSMYSLWGGVITFDTAKLIFIMLIPVVQFVQPILPLAMSLTMMIQAFASFTIALSLAKTNTQRGIAGLIGGVMAVTQPHIGLGIGLVISFVLEYLFNFNDEKHIKEAMNEGE